MAGRISVLAVFWLFLAPLLAQPHVLALAVGTVAVSLTIVELLIPWSAP